MPPDDELPNNGQDSFARRFLDKQHAEHGHEPLRYPDDSGQFPKPFFQRLIGEPLPIVADTNVLLGDCVTGYKKDSHTVLVTGANTGAFHVFCPEHVLAEVPEKCEEFCSKAKADPIRLLNTWYGKVVPKLRIIPAGTTSDEILTGQERLRMSRLKSVDPDDVPAAQVALAAGAVFLTKDPAAWEAVYGEDANNEQLHKWANVLIQGSNAREMATVAFMTSTVPAAAVVGTVQFFNWAIRKSPLITGIGLLAAAFVASRFPKHSYNAFWSKTKDALAFAVTEIYAPYGQFLENFHKFEPPQPNWDEISSCTSRDAALTRACLHRMSRAYEPLSARELVGELPDLGISQGEQRVREILTSNPAFFKTAHGKWQLGWPSTHWSRT